MYVNFSVIVVIDCENKNWRRYIRAAPRMSCITFIQILHYTGNTCKYPFLLH